MLFLFCLKCVSLPFINLLCFSHENSPFIKKILFADSTFLLMNLTSSLHCWCILWILLYHGIYIELVYIYVLFLSSVAGERCLIWWSSHDWSIRTLSAWECCEEYQGELRKLPVLQNIPGTMHSYVCTCGLYFFLWSSTCDNTCRLYFQFLVICVRLSIYLSCNVQGKNSLFLYITGEHAFRNKQLKIHKLHFFFLFFFIWRLAQRIHTSGRDIL